MHTSSTPDIHPTDLYRLPWTLTDNVIGWLEPTKRCNLYCEGCYSRNAPSSDKTLAQIRSDLEVFVRSRRLDTISITGGDPLVHPQIVDIVRMVRHEFGLKPNINTNALALTPELVTALKRAGACSFTFHIDSGQTRPGWKGKTEPELNPLRLHYAEMVAREGGLSVSFNSTVYRHTLQHVPALVDWARDHIDIVHGMVFILFRTSRSEFDYYAHGKRVNTSDLVYFGHEQNPEPIVANEVVSVIRESDPAYSPSAYLGGTQDPHSFKWLLASRVGRPGKIHGYLGRRCVELAQVAHHLRFNRYFAYLAPKLLGLGRSTAFAASLVDGGARRIVGNLLRSAVRSPGELLHRLYVQSLLVVQPVDFMPDGAANMCDGCPDMTVFNGQLVWSCRLDERMAHGCFLQAVPKCPAGQAPVIAAVAPVD